MILETLLIIIFWIILYKKSAKQNQIEYIRAEMEPKNPSMVVIIKNKQTRANLAQYLYVACFSPVRSTFVNTITKSFFKTWPGLI